MAEEIKLPELGENIEGGDVVAVHVAAGDRVEKDQVLVDIETGKATVEVPSPVAGTVVDVKVAEGSKVSIGELLMTVDAQGVSDAAPEQGEQEKPAGDKPETPSKTPQASPQKEQEKSEPPPPAKAKVESSQSSKHPPVAAAPSVRRFAREIGISIEDVPAPESGRLTIDAVKAYAKSLNTQRADSGGVLAPPLPDFTKWGEIRRESMSKVREATAKHMAATWATVPHVTQHDVADITELEAFRRKYGKSVEKEGGKLTVTAMALKVIAAALKVFPQFNASLDMAAGEVVYKNYTHIGVAVDTPRGLLVPVIRDVDQKNIRELAGELAEVAERARSGKTSLDELQGGCFTITNLGGIGGGHFTPIVNAPEVAILGLSRATRQWVVAEESGDPTVRLMLPLSLSYDHRIIDGADGARFLRWVKEALEQPMLMAL